MPITVHLLALATAAVLFLLAGLGVASGRFSLIALGLFFVTVALLVP